MKTGRVLPELAAELCRRADAKRDFLVPAKELRLSTNGASKLYVDELIGSAFAVNDIAHGQLAEYAGIPKTFYDRMRSATEELRVSLHDEPHEFHALNDPLFDVVVNTLLKNKGADRRLIRTLDGTARALLSENFNVDLDNWDVLRMAASAMEQAGLTPEDVVSCEVTDRKLYLKVVSPKLEARIEPSNLHREHGGHHFLKEPQVVQAGFCLTNSEVGLGSLAIEQTVFKLMCTNLWILETPYRQRHVGKALESGEDHTVYRSDTRLADARTKLLKIRDHIQEALDENRFRALAGTMQQTAEVRLEGKVEAVVEATGKRFALSQGEKEDVLKHLIEGADLTLWGLSNAVTATAQTVRSYDRASELESIGGRFFTLPASELKQLARVA
jgi:hypothetical protein